MKNQQCIVWLPLIIIVATLIVAGTAGFFVFQNININQKGETVANTTVVNTLTNSAVNNANSASNTNENRNANVAAINQANGNNTNQNSNTTLNTNTQSQGEVACTYDNDCVVVSKRDPLNNCCTGCTIEVVNKETSTIRGLWWAENCTNAVCPDYSCLQGKFPLPRCIENQCVIEWVDQTS